MRWISPVSGGEHKFHQFEDFLHLDEKWFYIVKNGQRHYLYKGKDLPIRKVKHKFHITKLIFLLGLTTMLTGTACSWSLFG